MPPTQEYTPRDRVMAALRCEPSDRVPLSYWFGWNPENRDALVARYGDMDAALDALRIDTRTATLPSMVRPPMDRRCATAREALDLPVVDDPLDPDRYEKTRAEFEAARKGTDPRQSSFTYSLREAVDKFGGRYAVFVHVWGVTEICQGYFGIEGLLMNLAADPQGTRELLMRAGEFSAACAAKAIEYGPDAIQISDDWGMNERLLFRPEVWWETVYPAMRLITDAVRGSGVPLILHSDGHVLDVMDGIVELGFSALHPVQSSAGMDQADVKHRYGDRLAIYGGLDITHTLPFGTPEQIDAEIRNAMQVLGQGGGYLFAPAHMVQPDAVSIERTPFFYERARFHGREAVTRT